MSKWFSADFEYKLPYPNILSAYSQKTNRVIDYRILYPDVVLTDRVKCKIRTSIRGSYFLKSIFIVNVKCKNPDDLLILKLTI